MSEDSQNKKPLALEKAIEAYRVLAAPARLSKKYDDNGWARTELDKYCGGSRNARDLLKIQDPGSHGAWYYDDFLKNSSDGVITIAPGMKAQVGVSYGQSRLSDLVGILTDPVNKDIKKTERKIVFSTNDGTRASGDDAFVKWNGFQVIDMDIKNAGMAKALKPYIFKALQGCNWFFGVTLSASGTGLHIYTKIKLPTDEMSLDKRRLMFLVNFRHKYSFVYLACLKAAGELGFTADDLKKWLDISMIKPAQGAFIGYDPDVMLNVNFFEDWIYVSFDNVEDVGCPEVDWVTHPDLKVIFARWEWFESNNDNKIETKLLNTASEAGPDPDNKEKHDKVHYKHNERWRLANTLVNIFAERDENGTIKNVSLPIHYLRGVVSNVVPDKELVADCLTAARHSKPIDPWAVNRLNNVHGFRIKIEVDGEELMVENNNLNTFLSGMVSPNRLKSSNDYQKFNITKDQYLSDILDELVDRFTRITLIEAGPGLGKTEMVKQLVARGKKVMMILPFTSIIKSKVEKEPGWYYSYGSRQPKLDVECGLALTIDKFSRLSQADIKTAGFDYIFLDESHLLFMSEYRPVMSKVIDMIRNTQTPIVLMSGTPTGELIFFPNITHLHVIREETRQKTLNINIVDSTNLLFYHMCKAMAQSIANNKRVLHPSNEGTLYSKRIQAGVQYFLKTDHNILEPINLQYYKKSNLGDEFMDDVNFHKTIKDVNIVMCTTYMGCGVDIEDRLEFDIYFSDLCTAMECDQWCNRLRRNNLVVNMYVAKNDADGNSRHIWSHKEVNFKLDDEEIRFVHSVLQMCNSMIERNPIEYKYNNVIQSVLSDNRYIKYDDVQCKYYIDEIAFKTIMFERKYRDFAEQLPIFIKGMEDYGYDPLITYVSPFVDGGLSIFKDIKNMVKSASDEQVVLNTEHTDELIDLINDTRIELYKAVMAGMYEIRKGSSWSEDEDKRIMIVKNVEVFEKVVPIFVSMSKRFEISTIKDIFEYCKNNNKYNFSAISRIRTLINIVESDEANTLDVPVKEFMKRTHDFIVTKIEGDKIKDDIIWRSKEEINKFCEKYAIEYAKQASNNDIYVDKSKTACQRLTNIFKKLFRCLVKCSHPNKEGRCTMEKIELFWEPKKFFLEKVNDEKALAIDEFLEECAHINSTKVKRKPLGLPEPKEQMSDRSVDARKIIKFNEDGTRSIEGMDPNDPELHKIGEVED